MKLLMISGDRSLAQRKAGAFFQMLEEFSKYWERIDIVCPRAKFQHPNTTIQLPSNVFLHPSPYGLWYQPFWIRKKGLKLIEEHRHDVMTVHEYPPFYNGIGARWLRRWRKIPAAIEIHHIVGWPKSASIHEWVGRILSRGMLVSHTSHFQAVRTVNSSVRDLLIQWGANPEQIHLVPSFYLERTMLQPDPAARQNYDIVFCARLVDNKGLLPLLEALRKLSGVSMLVIGDGPLRKKAERTALEYGLQSRVTFARWLPTWADVARAMQSGRVFVMPSLSEGGPRSALEAMACGVPVIATRVGVMPDVISDGINGFFTTGEAPDLAEKIRSLLADPEKIARIGREAARVIEKFEKRATIKTYADFLKDVVNR